MASPLTTDGRAVRSRGLKTRARLLEAATRVFGDRGFHAARVDDIVEAAATSHGTFYVYFASKEALFDELVAEVGLEMARLVDDMPEVGTGSDDERAAVRGWLERFAEFYQRSGAVLRAWTEVESAAEPAGATGSDLLHHLADSLGSRIVSDGSNGSAAKPAGGPSVDPSIASLALMAMIERFNYYAISGRFSAEPEEVLDTLTDLVTRALVRRAS